MITFDNRLNTYYEFIKEINKSISGFNKYLSDKNIIPPFNTESEEFKLNFLNITKYSWKDLRIPCAEKKGVYFIFGYNTNINKCSLYIGKASSRTSSIFSRITNHLRKDRNNTNYFMYDLAGNNHILEYILPLDLSTSGMNIFSNSLEEYLIINLSQSLLLLNGTNNRNLTTAST